MPAKSTDLNRRLQIIIMLALLVRVILTFAFQTDWEYMNPDEERSYTIAQNYLAGHGYTFWNEQTQQWEQTSYHAPFNTFMYVTMQQWHIPKLWWVMFIQMLSIVMYAVGAIYFFRLGKEVLEEKFAFWGTVVYLFFPSIIFYIGILFTYENITVPLMIIALWQMVQVMKGQFKKHYWFTIPLIVTISVLVRPSMLALYAFTLAGLFLMALWQKNRRFLSLAIVTGVVLFIAHIPSFQKNHKQFGVWSLSNQTGFELMQGHSDVARGSWRGGWLDTANIFYKYSEEKIPGVYAMNERAASEVRGEFAKQWIKDHPAKELELCARKIGIFLLPKNYEVLPTFDIYNPVNAAVYLLSVIGMFMLLCKRRMNVSWFIIIAPVIGTVVLSLIFFVSYRARYFAEPFMCLLAMLPVQEYFKRRKIVQPNS